MVLKKDRTYNGGIKITGYPSVDKMNLKGISYFEQNPITPSLSISDTINLMYLFGAM